MTSRTLNKMGESSSLEDKFDERVVDEDYTKVLKGIGNDIEQIQEIDQSLKAVGHEIVEELLKVLQLVNRIINFDGFLDNFEVTIYPNGFVIIRNGEGEDIPRSLIDLEPSLLNNILRQLIPELKSSLEERKKVDGDLLEQLTRVRDAFS